MSQRLKRLGIIGCGQIGTSLGMCLRAQGVEVYGLEPDLGHQKLAQEKGAVDALVEVPEALPEDLELVVLAVPLSAIPSLLPRIPAAIPALTDTATLKLPVLEAARILPNPGRFLGSHPLAGREIPGPQGAIPGLFQGKPWFYTPEPPTPPEVRERVLGMITLAGGVPIPVPASLHDDLVHRVIGLPHLLAYSLLMLLREEGEQLPLLKEYAGGSLRDQLRVAHSSPEMWGELFPLMGERLAPLAERLYERMKRLLELARTPQELKEELRSLRHYLEITYG